MIIIYINGVEYAKCFQKVEWSGGINGSSRVLQVQYEYNKIKLKLGDKVEFKLNNTKTLFLGKIFELTSNANKTTNTFKAYDASIYLNKNKFVKNYFNRVPSEIVKEICGELRLSVGELPSDKVKCTFPAIGRSGYEIILAAYTIQHNKDKIIYSLVCNGENIEIVEQGVLLEGVNLNTKIGIREAEYTESLEDMINQIVVYKTENEKAQIIDKVANEQDKRDYGLFQDTIEYTKDMNNIFNAKDMLKGVKRSGSIRVGGNPNLQSGYRVAIEEINSGFIGSFLIESDSHIFENGDYYTNLNLIFENTMDKIDFEKNRRKTKENVVDVEISTKHDYGFDWE